MTDFRAQLQSTLGDAYTIERELGGGGMSRVFVAREESLGRNVVVKVLPSETAGAVSVERFRREIRLAASLQQANIVPVLTAGDASGVAYYTMPFVKGESLRSKLAAKGALPVAECVAILRDVARALAFAHEEGVVHRDIKPENILLSGGTAVVTDFGIAKAVAASTTLPGAATLTQMGMALGTPAYMAPEQAVGEDVDHRADIYALGVVAYEMLSGAAPFAGRSAQAMLAAHAMEAPAPISSKCPEAPAGLVHLLTRCLAKEPADRPQTAAEVLASLELSALRSAPAAIHGKPSIAVLPFGNVSADPSDAHFADGFADEIITDLSPIHSLRVLASASMMKYRGTTKDPLVVATELGVRWVLSGTLRRAEKSLRVTARLIDAQDGSTLWTDKVNGTIDQLFAMQEQVSNVVVNALRLRLTPQEAGRYSERTAPRTRNGDAVEAYLQGTHFYRQATTDTLLKARERFQRAIELDPSFAQAHAKYAQITVHLTTGWVGLPPREAMPQASAAAKRALELDQALPEAHLALALVESFYEWDVRAANRSFAEALRLNPNYAEAHAHFSVPLMWLDTRFEEAVDHAKRGVELSPLDPWARFQLLLAHYFGRDFENALAEGERLLELEPLWGLGHYIHGATLATAGKPSLALNAFRRALDLDGRAVHIIAWLGVSHALAGDERAARECLAELEEHGRAGKSVWSWILCIRAALNETDQLMDCLEQAFAERSSALVFHLTHPLCDALRGTPRFTALLRRMGLEHLVDYRPASPWRPPAALVSVAAGPAKPSVAVLPLINMSASADDEYFSDGMTEDIIAQLSQIASLKVISRTSVMQYKKTGKSAKVIAGELGASHLVEGSVRRAGQRLRIVAKLIDASSDAQIWSQTFDRDMTDVFAVQAEVAEQVTGSLRARLAPEERARISRKPTEDQEAYNLFLLARHHLNAATADGFGRAIDLYTQSVERDPNFARAWAALAFAHFFHIVGYYALPRDVVPKVVEYANRALTLDPEIAEAHVVLGIVEEIHNYDQAASERRKRRAVELNPNSADAQLALGNHLVVSGQSAAALAAADRALELDPASELTHLHANWLRYLARDLDGALRGLIAAETLFGKNLLPTVRAETLVAMGRAKEGAGVCRELCAANPIPINVGVLAWCLAAAGARDEALQVIAELRARETSEYVWPMPIAIAYAHLGEMDLAFEYLERCYENRVAWIQMAYSPSFDPFRRDARFADMIRRVGAVDPAVAKSSVLA